MTSNDPATPPDEGRDASNSTTSSTGKDGIDKLELSDLDASPPPLPIESDLMQLARLGELRAIQKLFDSGKYNSRSTDDQGITALHWAAINGHHALCHFLLSSGADVNAKGGDAQATPVLWASKRFNLPVISLLLTHGADPLIRDDQGYNLLHSATLDGNVFQLILLLHQPDLPVDVPDAHGHTSLMWAAYKGFPACIDILLRCGADVHAVDDMGFTALHWALVRGSYACIQKLVEHGSDFSMRSKPTDEQPEGDTPSMTASRMGSERQWLKALHDTGYTKDGAPVEFPLTFVKDKRWFFKCFFFLWPFALGGCQLYMLAHLPVWASIPGVLLLGYALQFLVKKLLRWTPSDMKTIQRTPMLAGVFAGSLFWVGVRFVFLEFPTTFRSHPFLNIAFASCYGFCTYFYFMTMAMDPGFIPKGASRGQTKKTIDDLLDHNAFNETHFCTTCMIRKPLRSKHCKRCGRCVAREDHHCPWVDNCIGINNHKQFILYVMWMIAGLLILVQLTIKYLEILPAPTDLHCTFLSDVLCSQLSKDPLTIITNGWGCLQMTWTFMLLFVHFFQIAQNLTTYESMRNTDQVGPVLSAITTGTMSLEDAQVTDGHAHSHAHHHGHAHGHGHKHAKKETFFGQWARLLGIDTFITIAFQGYRGTQGGAVRRERTKKRNPYSRGLARNCQDFWLAGRIFGQQESGDALLDGGRVNYTRLYDIPRSSRGAGSGHAYEELPVSEGAGS